MPKTAATKTTTNTVLTSLGFQPIAVKAPRGKKTVSSHTIKLTNLNTKGIVTFRLGEEARTHFGETIDVYANADSHTVAFLPTTGAPQSQTATIKPNGSFTVATLSGIFPATYLGKGTYDLTWHEEGYGTITLKFSEIAETQTAEPTYA